MSDLILQPAGLRPLSAANSSVWAGPLASLARLGGNLVGPASFTADASPRSSVPLAAGLSGFLGTGGAAPAATPQANTAAMTQGVDAGRDGVGRNSAVSWAGALRARSWRPPCRSA